MERQEGSCRAINSPIGRFEALGAVFDQSYAQPMNTKLRKLPLNERIRLVEDLWDSIAEDRGSLRLTPEQRAELAWRIVAYKSDRDPGRPAEEVIADIRSGL